MAINLKILQSETIYKNFYSKLFINDVGSEYITLLSKVYLTDNGTIYLEGQNLENKPVFNTLEKQQKLIQNDFSRLESIKDDYSGNYEGALEFFEDKLEFLNSLKESLKV